MASGVEVFLTECRNARDADSGDAHGGDFKSANVLVSLSADLTDRAVLRCLPHALTFGRTSTAVYDGAEWPERLRERLKLVEIDFGTATVYVGSGVDVVAETVQLVIDTLRDVFGAKLAVLVVVSAATDRVSDVLGASGFVRGVHVTNAETAQLVFLTLAMFGAPRTLNGIDVADLLPVLGPVDAPTMVAWALWLRDGEGKLVSASDADERTIKQARQIVTVPLIRGWTWAELNRFRRGLCSVADPEAETTVFAALDAIQPGLMPDQVTLVPILCRAQIVVDGAAMSPTSSSDSLPLTPTTQGE